MSDEANGQEKKSPADKTSYTEKVTVKHWTGDKFLTPSDNIPAFRTEIKEQTVFYTKPRTSNSHSPKGSEITDDKGVTWVVSKVSKGTTFHINYVTKKP